MYVSASNSEVKLKSLMELYHKAAKTKEGNAQLASFLASNRSQLDDQTYKVFSANVHFFNAQYFDNPFKKFSEFKKGKEILESLISENPQQCLFRYFRFAVQINSPAILDYQKNIQEDKRLLIDYLQNCDFSSNYLCKSFKEIVDSHK